MRHNIIAGLDIGTTKICAVVAEAHAGGINILGMGVSPSAGMRKGMVINIDEAVASIKSALAEAEACTGVRIKSVSAGISGSHIKGFNTRGFSGVSGREVTSADIVRALQSARSVCIPVDREILHAIPYEYVLDGQEGIKDPSGMSGSRLEAGVHIITGAISAIENLLKCCEKAGLDVVDLVFEPLASAEATLTKVEKDSGVMLVDIGGGTTDMALYREGRLRHASVLGVGGSHLTNDIAVGLRLPMADAETLKKTSGSKVLTDESDVEGILVTQAGGQVKTVTPQCLAGIIAPRCEEILNMVKAELKDCRGYEQAVCGVVLTGGSSMLGGLDKIAEAVLGLPVRIGLPAMTEGPQEIMENPQYSTGVGLLGFYPSYDRVKTVNTEGVNSLLSKMRHWAKDIFRNSETINPENKKEGGITCSKSKR
ncbi:MAG: cell division protein FtsA [Nitrospirae bacterium]|nr:cell division protein FtsA [Nitrospirota bacterium]